MKLATTKTTNRNGWSAFWNDEITVCQWDRHLSGKQVCNYFVVSRNVELAEMQGVKPGNLHIECFVDDFGNLVKVAA